MESIKIPIYLLVCCERGECRGYGHQFRPNDGAGLFCSRGIYIDDGAGEDVNHSRSQSGMAANIGSIRVDPVFREKFRCPRVGDNGRALQGRWHSVVLDWE